MSSHGQTPHAPAHESASQAHHGHSNGHQAGHGTLRSYLIGFSLSVILTAIPFWLVMSGAIDSKLFTAFLVMGLGVIQIVVHMVYFLHMNPRSEGGWTMMALLFTLVLVGITLAGSLWVMHHLNTNMMPMSPEMMKNMP
ncbi:MULTISPECIES: cytochrome o ubiquinol oxidase subunit IV [Neorhizobium]|jgi:cytochrome o ubiquinol oxidase operon protein cyoD|uniref:Cytochrome bo(3) ubiquinol oxidase subunit 4 n=1 Tax=Neorhizobium galegae bv. officinalis TaxID=323656 RepID=A0A0T7FEG0_NEOGA|nr:MULTISPECIES: cytochrome o ubiquinol oxidase subunit IV [Neorhizobium]MBP2561764.1 cytochrome o ubiquinol oxidase operon protein cyoD [Neorhizobium galegae]MDQ0134766.1 cytochrome o ubiquinol oxidase operon protein cyoD [Neorhizobium galegae]UIK07974.1 cytochrome o ubiquinol oxidase subunit IV [Neorhizobium galegae]CDZ33417.1 Cytochrome o ubiquinol oxidase subunit IV [Neorhizobium galegae bv. officinalis]CDZ52002.1 Cytochrome o ubiquinol oxidase subunit IV [Neorhizobium galegae bv. officina